MRPDRGAQGCANSSYPVFLSDNACGNSIVPAILGVDASQVLRQSCRGWSPRLDGDGCTEGSDQAPIRASEILQMRYDCDIGISAGCKYC
jgi:hypothetical protein